MRYLKQFISIVLSYFLLLAPAAGEAADIQRARVLPQTGVELTLQQCIKLAALNSFEVRLARLDFMIAQTGQSAAEAIFDTTLSLDAEYSKDERQPLSALSPASTTKHIYSVEAAKTLPTGTELTLSLSDTRTQSDSAYVSENPSHETQAEIEVRQPLAKNAFGYNDRRSISLTSLAIENTDLDTKEKIEQLFADVEKAYWDWVFARENREIYRGLLTRAQDLHQANTRNYDIGLLEKGDFLASRANVLLREKDFALAETQYKKAEEKIKLLINIDAGQEIYPGDNFPLEVVEKTLDDCLVTAFAERRDYHKAKREIEIKNITLQTRANERWPEIDLVASLTANGIHSKFNEALDKITSEDNSYYTAKVEFSIPLENNEARSAFEKAKYNKEKAILELKKTERTIITVVGNALRDYRTYSVNLDRLEQAAELQNEKLTEEEQNFFLGRSSTKTLIDYQQDHLYAQLQLAQGLLDFNLARVNLEKALNTILERYGGIL